MDKKINIFLVVCFAVWCSACGTFVVGIERTQPPNYAMTATVARLVGDNSQLATQISLPKTEVTPILTTTSTQPNPTVEPAIITPTPTSTSIQPRFYNLRFSNQPDAAISQRFYVEGTTRVYALWDYANMKSDLTIRRVWYLNGQEWIVREETWDYVRYGEKGTIRDVSIFDEEIGLQAGEYALTIFINGVAQDLGDGTTFQERAGFWVFESDIRDSIASPNKVYTAYVIKGGHLLIEDANGKRRELVITQEISDIAWFPDNQHLVFTDRDRSKQVNEVENIGIAHKLWILDIISGERHLIGTIGENFHSPQVSPNGRFVAVLAGPTFREDCQASPTLAFLELDYEYRRQAVYLLSDFSELPFSEPEVYRVYPIDSTRPGRWESDTRLIVALWWSCLDTNPNPNGTYLLDFETKIARRIGD